MSARAPLMTRLAARGLLKHATSQRAIPARSGVYLGVDPTASSLHLGNLMPLMVLAHFYLDGHRVFPLIGGATGAVGDPSGRSGERTRMEDAARVHNVQAISAQMRALLENSTAMASKYAPVTGVGEVRPVNNLDWWQNVRMLDFMSTFGRHIRVQQMLARDSVSARMGTEAGLGYNEFSYQVMQAYDFYHLYTTFDCAVQLGGSDQWGNIVAGVDLISRLHPDAERGPVGLTTPLLVDRTGTKFGKSEGNAVFLDREMTKPYSMYQYLLKQPDDMVAIYLKALTFIPLAEIAAILEEHGRDASLRLAQRRLAREVTELAHGRQGMESAESVSDLVFGGHADSDPARLIAAFEDQQLLVALPAAEVLGREWKHVLPPIVNQSKSAVLRLIESRALYAGLARQPVTTKTVEPQHVEPNGLLLLRTGKTNYYAIRLV